MAMQWVYIANLMGPPGDANAMNRFNAIEQKNGQQDAAISEIEIKNTVQDGRLKSVEDKNTQQDGRLVDVEAKNTTQDGRLDNVEIQTTAHDGRLTGIDGMLDAIEPFLLRTADSKATNYAIPFVDEDGGVAGGVHKTGYFNFELPPRTQGQSGVTFQPVMAPGWWVAFTDADGYVAFGVKTDGTVVAPKLQGGGGGTGGTALEHANTALGYTRTLRNKVTAIGDSLTEGFFGGLSGQTADAWPAKLQTLVGGSVTVTNLAASGLTVDEEAVRIGVIPVPLTVEGGQIPASGPVPVTTTAVIGWRALGINRSFSGSLAGIPGTLARKDSDTVFTFTRTTAGTAVPVPAGTVWASALAGRNAETLVIMLGHNNVAYDIRGTDATVAAHVRKGIKRIVDWHSRDLKQVLFLSVTPKSYWLTGDDRHSTCLQINAELFEDYGPRYYNLHSYLVNRAIYDLGLTPTAEDLTAIAGNTLPPSIMDPGDTTHWSKATAALVGQRVHEYLTTRDWILS